MADLARQTMIEVLSAEQATGGIRVRIVDPACQLYLSGPTDLPSFHAAISTALGFALPQEPNRVAGEVAYAVWLAPERWLVVSDDRKAGELAAALQDDAAGGFVSEVTDGLTVFELAGPAVRDLLAMGCSLDLTA